jgi:hypothetical protein
MQSIECFQVQHFISDSNWSFRSAIDMAAIQTSNALLRRKLTGLDYTYMPDIHSNQTVFLEKPQWVLP